MATKTVSVLTGGTNNHSTTSEEVNAFATDILMDGVVGAISATSGVAPTTGSFAVNAQGTPNMTVRVSAGQAYITATPTSGNSQRVRVSMATYEDVTIAANSTGGTRFDHLYISLDAAKLKDPASDASDVATLVTSRSTSSTTDNGTPPTYGYKLAVVTVANGATSIANANIAESRTQVGATTVSSTLPAGAVVQVQDSSTSSVSTGTTVIPVDNTIPQSTEGDQYMTVSITPKASTNKLIIEVVAFASLSVAGSLTVALFQDSTANALAASNTYQATATGMVTIPLSYTMTAGTTSSTTFKVRIGGSTAGTTTFNGSSGASLFSTVGKSYVKVTEVKV